MTKSELIDELVRAQPNLSTKLVDEGIKEILEQITHSLEQGSRVEIRGFGSFALHHRDPRVGRNPKTGRSVEVAAKAVPHFKPGKALRDAVNESADK